MLVSLPVWSKWLPSPVRFVFWVVLAALSGEPDPYITSSSVCFPGFLLPVNKYARDRQLGAEDLQEGLDLLHDDELDIMDWCTG